MYTPQYPIVLATFLDTRLFFSFQNSRTVPHPNREIYSLQNSTEIIVARFRTISAGLAVKLKR
jgi:hypothetical protein